MTVEFYVSTEIFGPRWKTVRKQANELFGVRSLERVVCAALLADGRRAFGSHLAAAKRSGSVSRVDRGLVGHAQKLFVKALKEHRGELLRRVIAGKIGTADIADKESVTGENRFRTRWIREICHRDANAFQRVAGRRNKIETAAAELDRVAALHRHMRELRSRTLAEIDARSGAGCEFMVSGDKIGMKMRLDDVLDLQTLLASGFEIDVDVTLWIDDRSYAFR